MISGGDGPKCLFSSVVPLHSQTKETTEKQQLELIDLYCPKPTDLRILTMDLTGLGVFFIGHLASRRDGFKVCF